MKRNTNVPRPDEMQQSPTNESFPGVTPGRTGEDDSLENSSPIDIRSDEKVIAHEQRANKTENAPSQTAANKSGVQGNDDDILEGRNQKGSF